MKGKHVLYILICIIAIDAAGIAQGVSKDFEIKKLDEGVFAAIHKAGGRAICNAGIIDLGTSTLVFDPFISPYAAEELKRVIAEMGLSPVKYVVNSHYHDDHIRGNQVFKNALIYSTSLTRDLIEKTEPEEFISNTQILPGIIAKSDSVLSLLPSGDSKQKTELIFWNSYYKTIFESLTVLHTVLPDKIIHKQETIQGEKQSVELIDMGMGHTGSDLILYLPKSKIIFTGDLLFIKNHTYIADGDLDSLKQCLYRIRAMKPGILVPGHGPTGNKKDIDRLLDYLNTVNRIAEVQIKKGLKPEQVKDLTIPKTFETWKLDRFYLPNIKFQMNKLLLKNSPLK